MGLPVAVALGLGGGDVDGVRVPLPERLPEGVKEDVAEPVGLHVRLPDAVPLGFGGGVMEGVPVALGVRDGDTVAVGVEGRHFAALGTYK